MKKKFMKVALFGVLTLTAGASIVGCSDYDKDISSLNDQLATTKSDLESKTTALQASIASLEAAKVDVAAVLASAKTESDKAALKAKEEAIASSLASMKAIEADLKAKINANTTDIAALNAQVLAIDKAFAALSGEVAQIQKMILGYDGLVETVGKLQSADSRLEAGITTLSKETKQSIKDLQEQITAVKTQIGVLGEGANVASELNALLENLNSQKEALKNAATKEDLAAANQLIADNATSIKELSNQIESDLNVLKSYFRSMITGITIVANSDASMDNAIELNIVKTVTAVDFGKGLNGGFSYKADDINFMEDNFLVQVTPSTANFPKDAITIIRSDGKNLMDFVTIEATAYEGVLTRAASANGLWKVSVKLKEGYKKADFDALTKVGGKNSLFAIAISDVENENTRVLASAYDLTFATADFSTTPFAQADLKANGAAVPSTAVAAEINKPFAIKLTTVAGKTPVYGSYITLDPDATTAEKALWKTFGIEGLDNVTKTNECTIIAKSPAAKGQVVRFVIHAIDFGGRSGDVTPTQKLSVSFGQEIAGTAELKVALLPEAKVTTTYDMLAAIALTGDLIGTDAWAKEIKGADLTVEFKDASGANVFAAAPTAKFFKADGTSEVANLNTEADNKLINKVKLAGIDLTKIPDGGQVEGALLFKNTTGNLLSKVTVTLSKTMPAFPAAFKVNDAFMQGDVLKLYPDYKTVGNDVTYDFTKAFQGITTDCIFDEDAETKTIGVDFSTVNQIKAPKAMVGSGTQIATKVTYDFGKVSSVDGSTTKYVTTWGTPFKCELRSMPKDAELTLAKNVKLEVEGQKDADLIADVTAQSQLVYGDIRDKAQIKLNDATDLAQAADMYTRLKGSSDHNTFFTAAFSTNAIKLIAVSNAVDLPRGAHDFELVFTITDKFGNEFEKVVPFTVNK